MPVAQRLEQRTHNSSVEGSNPSGRTRIIVYLLIMKKLTSFAQAHPDALHLWDTSNTLLPEEVSQSSSKKIIWVCPVCNHTWEAPVNRMHTNLTKKKTIGCLQCYRKKQRSSPLSVTDPEIYSHISPDNTIDISQITRASRKEIKFDLSCGHNIVISPRKMHRKNGQIQLPKCKICTLLSTKRPDLQDQYSDKNDIDFSSLSYNSAYKAIWKCENNHEWEATVYQRVNFNTSCPKCVNNSSSQKEEELYTYVRSIVPENIDILRNDKKLLQGKEIDILIPEYKIGIEFNGLYWHGESQGKDRNYHKNKYLVAKEHDVNLITIWEDDWDENKNIVKSMITHKLGCSTSKKVYARKTFIKDIEIDDARKFMDSYHIQGYTQGSYYLGLYDDTDNLVAVSIWRKNKNTLYLDRYATSCTVVGGMGKLLSYVLQQSSDWCFNEIVTFSDHEVSDGGLYKKLGFEKDKELKPDYKYIVNKERVHKFNYRRKRFKNDPHLIYKEELSESEMAKLNGIDRVWDCGKTRWKMNVVS